MHPKASFLRAATLRIVGLLLMQTPVGAKGPVDMISVDGPGLRQSVEITDEDALRSFNPWGRQFIDWKRDKADAPPPSAVTYTVSFYLEDQVIYILEYARDPANDSGLIYIPGPKDAAYELNIRTILGASSSDAWNPEGRWQFATREWVQLMLAIDGIRPPATGDGGSR